ncbi:MAG: Signal recognition particle protein Ffh, partial [uncultured Frankineae bacterium]
GREVLRRRHGRAHGRQDDGGQGVRPRGLPRADDAGQEDGLAVEPARHAARHGPDEGRPGPGRRQGPRPHRRDHPVDDAAGAADAEDPQRLPPAAHRQGLGRHRHRGQQPRRPLLRRPEDDEADGRHGGHGRDARAAGRAQGQAPAGLGQEGQEGSGSRRRRAVEGQRRRRAVAGQRRGRAGAAARGVVRREPNRAAAGLPPAAAGLPAGARPLGTARPLRPAPTPL